MKCKSTRSSGKTLGVAPLVTTLRITNEQNVEKGKLEQTI